MGVLAVAGTVAGTVVFVDDCSNVVVGYQYRTADGVVAGTVGVESRVAACELF